MHYRPTEFHQYHSNGLSDITSFSIFKMAAVRYLLYLKSDFFLRQTNMHHHANSTAIPQLLPMRPLFIVYTVFRPVLCTFTQFKHTHL